MVEEIGRVCAKGAIEFSALFDGGHEVDWEVGCLATLNMSLPFQPCLMRLC